MGFINSPLQFGSSEFVNDSLHFVLELESFFEDDAITEGNDILDLEILLDSEFEDDLIDSNADDDLELQIDLNGEINDTTEFLNSLELVLNLDLEINDSLLLNLVQPDPILNQIAANPFSAKTYGGRVKNGSDILPVKRIVINAPRGSLGKTVEVELADKNINLAAKNGNYKVEVGKANNISDPLTWTTILENAELNTRSHTKAWLNYQLSFGIISPLSDKLNLSPLENLIVFDPVKISVSIDEIENISDIDGNVIATNLQPINALNLYQLLNIAFVSGCGFSEVKTNVPNFQLTRCDFTIFQSWYDAVKAFLGIFETVVFAVGDVLWIVDKTQPIPDDFEPRSISPDDFINWQQTIPSVKPIDGFILQYIESNVNSNASTDRLEQPPNIVLAGSFGSDDYSYKEIERTWRDYYHTDKPNVVLDSILLRSKETTYKGLTTIINRDTETYSYDAQGKRRNTQKVSEKLVPDLNNSGALSLLTVQTINQSCFYKPDRFNPRMMAPDKTITNSSGLIAVDSENKYFDQDFKQSVDDAHKAGNLKEGMTFENGSIKTIVETFIQLGNGQVQVITESVDFVRNISNTSNNTRVADLSVNSLSGKQKSLIIWKEGQSAASRDGNGFESLFVGELPLFFAIPFAERKHIQREARLEDGTIEVFGFEESIDKGVYFGVSDENGDLIGNFICEGYSAEGIAVGDGMEWRMRIDVTQVQ